MSSRKTYKNILVVRTDRIGDVALTTPALEALRHAYPQARIALVVTPLTYDIVSGNPFVNEVLIYDQKGRHRGFVGFWRFIFELKKRRFDIAINYHLKNRTNLMLFHAGIPARIGFRNRKFGFLLTRQYPDPRTDGAKHEAEYCLELLKHLGVEPLPLRLHVTVRPESEQWVSGFLAGKGFSPTDRIVAVHPGASCISKRWPSDRFAEAIDRLAKAYLVKVALIGAEDNLLIAREVLRSVRSPVVDLTGQMTISQLISFLKRSCLLISNDSGPVHLAVGVKTPVVSIFGRNQPGLSVCRWRPLGPQDISLHREAGCEACLAHDCPKGFLCLQAITADNVVEAAGRILG